MPSAASQAAARYIEDCVLSGGTSSTMRETLDRVRVKFAQLISCEPDEIAITKNVSEGLNAVVTALNWGRGDNAIVCADIEHPNGIYCLYNMRDRYGVEVRSVAPQDGTTFSVEAVANVIDSKTRVVVASSVMYTTGSRTDLSKLAALCRTHGALLLIDGAQSVGAQALNVRQTPIDALVVGASKYLCGPSGLGFLYVKRDCAESLQPGSLSRYGVDLGDAHEGEKGGEHFQLMPGARRFEGGSFNYLGLNVIEPSLDIIERLTMPDVERHVMQLARQFSDGVQNLGLSTLVPPDSSAFSHVVVLAGTHHRDAAQSFDRATFTHLRDNNVKLSIRDGRMRFAFHFYNTSKEVATVLSLIQEQLASN